LDAAAREAARLDDGVGQRPLDSYLPSGPTATNGGDVIYRYRIREADGTDAGEAHYAVLIQPGQTIRASDGRTLRVLEVVTSEDESDEYVETLRVGPV
jgi:hypothetical protein